MKALNAGSNNYGRAAYAQFYNLAQATRAFSSPDRLFLGRSANAKEIETDPIKQGVDGGDGV